MQDDSSDIRTGVLAALGAYVLWGFLPVYFIFLRGVPPQEVLLYRILFAVPVGAAIVLLRRQGAEVRRGLTSPRLLMALGASAFFIAANWLIYIAAVQAGKIFQASLGYYINPLIYVLVGVVVLGERLRPRQMAAVVLAAIGVTILTIYGGEFPLISLALAITFTIYGYVRKTAVVGAMPGLFVETLLLFPLAAVVLWWMASQGTVALEGASLPMALLLMAAGPFTVIPLLLFAIGARRLRLATLGFLQFVGPTIQFVVGLIDGEAFTPAHQLCFAFIWAAAALFAWDAWQARPEKQRRAAAAES